MAKAKPSYTLSSLRAALAPACASQEMSVPSLISLKNWSARGEFKRAYTLDEAIKVVIDRMSRNRGAYQLTAQPLQPLKPDLSQHEAWLQAELEKRVRSLTSHKTTAPAGVVLYEDDDGPLKVRGEVLDDAHADDMAHTPTGWSSPQKDTIQQGPDLSQKFLMNRIDSLEDQMRMVRHDVQAAIKQLEHHAALAAGKESINPALTQAIEQLDAVRKHLMQRMDAELQLVRVQSQSPGTPTPAQQSPQGRPSAASAESDLMAHRVLLKLSRIESLLASNQAS